MSFEQLIFSRWKIEYIELQNLLKNLLSLYLFCENKKFEFIELCEFFQFIEYEVFQYSYQDVQVQG